MARLSEHFTESNFVWSERIVAHVLRLCLRCWGDACRKNEEVDFRQLSQKCPATYSMMKMGFIMDAIKDRAYECYLPRFSLIQLEGRQHG